MTSLFLLIPDSPLCEAVIEQIKAAKLPAPLVVDSAQAVVKQSSAEEAVVIVVDDKAYDKKTITAWQGLQECQPKPVLLVLGDCQDTDLVTETFAKPFRLGHLMTRLRYYVETAPLLRDTVVEFGPYRLEPQNRHILCGDNPEPIRLTEKETALLVYLGQSTQPVTRQDILAAVWGYDERIDTHTLETHIYQLRRKLDGKGENWLVNEAGAYHLARIMS